MPEPIATVLIALVSAAIGAIASPVGRDWVARRAEARAAAREREARRRDVIERVRDILAGMSRGGSYTATQESLERDLLAAAYAVGDDVLTRAVEQLQQMDHIGLRGTDGWIDAHADASRRVGRLLNEQLSGK